LQEICKDHNIAIQTIKSITKGPWGDKPQNQNTWYEPLKKQEDIDKAVSWIIGHDQIFLNTAGDIQLLPKVLDAASRYPEKPNDEDMERMVREKRMTRLFVS
jgi:hypothetical protein